MSTPTSAAQGAVQNAPAPSSTASPVGIQHAGLPDGVTVLHGVLYDARPFVTFDATRGIDAPPDYLYLPSPRAADRELGGAQ